MDLDKNQIEPIAQAQSNKMSYSLIAGILLLIAGILALINWVQIFFIDVAALSLFIDISQLQLLDPSITVESIHSFLTSCAIVGCIIGIFQILGGLLSLKKKMWGIVFACSIIGLFSLGIVFISSILSFIALILLYFSRKEF